MRLSRCILTILLSGNLTWLLNMVFTVDLPITVKHVIFNSTRGQATCELAKMVVCWMGLVWETN